jgi:ABC-type lipoprotein release transport system permease subunit
MGFSQRKSSCSLSENRTNMKKNLFFSLVIIVFFLSGTLYNLSAQTISATTAAEIFRIEGIVKMPTPDFDNKIVYLPVDICQEFYNAPGMLTSLAVSIRKNDESEINRMIKSLGSGFSAR